MSAEAGHAMAQQGSAHVDTAEMRVAFDQAPTREL
jgi:hypothetical protein